MAAETAHPRQTRLVLGWLARERVEQWALLYEPGNAADLSRAIERLQGEPGLLPSLVRGLPAVPKPQLRLSEHVRVMEAVYAEAAALGPPSSTSADERELQAQERFLRAFDEGVSGQRMDP